MTCKLAKNPKRQGQYVQCIGLVLPEERKKLIEIARRKGWKLAGLMRDLAKKCIAEESE